MRERLLQIKYVWFNGYWYKSGKGSKYFRRGKGKEKVLLHRAVWEHYNGAIPAGCDIHHKFSNDLATTDPTRLGCISHSEHASLHSKGHTLPQSARDKLSRERKGVKRSQAAREAMSEGWKRRRAALLADPFTVQNTMGGDPPS
jgi:hypothetical protein